ncbi:hypothetical protein NDU88_000860 [Pleurodeles waltl]|uniref:Uncharacterized protein n=1 Tax=Pleurodeles waltl TaxID=8319 RepID=A0AAV7VA48_PLEWA|nr:hypothetical protein NDU88_000860 [Pleurodeles waltl]
MPSRRRREECLGTALTLKQWEMSMKQASRVSRNELLRFTQFSYFHHTYLTPHRLHRMFPAVPSMWPHCRHPGATFLHMQWESPALTREWERVMEHISDVVDVQLQTGLFFCPPGVTKRSKWTKVYLEFADLAMVLCRRLIAMSWTAPLDRLLATGGI